MHHQPSDFILPIGSDRRNFGLRPEQHAIKPLRPLAGAGITPTEWQRDGIRVQDGGPITQIRGALNQIVRSKTIAPLTPEVVQLSKSASVFHSPPDQ